MDNARSRQPAAKRPSALRPYALLLGAFAVVAGATVVLANRGDDPATSSGPGSDTTATAANTPPPAECGYDPAATDVRDLTALVEGRPFRGAEDAPVRVVEVFDPNCPHCKDMESLVVGVAERQGARARVYQVPYPLWDYSFGQVAALYLAQEQGGEAYHNLVSELFERQGGPGMNRDEVVAAAEAAGINGANLRLTLADSTVMRPLLERIQADRQAVAAALGVGGRMSVPKLAIDGRLVASNREAYTAECLDRLVGEAYAARTGAAPDGSAQ